MKLSNRDTLKEEGCRGKMEEGKLCIGVNKICDLKRIVTQRDVLLLFWYDGSYQL